jgi:hypothetical protein
LRIVNSSYFCALGFSAETAQLFHYRSYPYPVRQWETCPRGKRACSKAKATELSACQSLPFFASFHWISALATNRSRAEAGDDQNAMLPNWSVQQQWSLRRIRLACCDANQSRRWNMKLPVSLRGKTEAHACFIAF